MTDKLAHLIDQMTVEEQAELETFAAFLLVRRNWREPELLTEEISSVDLARLAQVGGAFDWLADEPDMYSLEEGDDVEWPANS